MSKTEKEHIMNAFSFELGKVKSKSIQQQVVDMFGNVSMELATGFADAIGVNPPQGKDSGVTKSSPALSQENTEMKPATRKVAVIIGSDFNGKEVKPVLDALKEVGIHPEILSEKLGVVKGIEGTELEVDHTFLTADSVLFDAVYAVGTSKGKENKAFYKQATYFIQEAFSHYKPIGATAEGKSLLNIDNMDSSPGVVCGGEIKEFSERFIQAISDHRHWEREVV